MTVLNIGNDACLRKKYELTCVDENRGTSLVVRVRPDQRCECGQCPAEDTFYETTVSLGFNMKIETVQWNDMDAPRWVHLREAITYLYQCFGLNVPPIFKHKPMGLVNFTEPSVKTYSEQDLKNYELENHTDWMNPAWLDENGKFSFRLYYEYLAKKKESDEDA